MDQPEIWFYIVSSGIILLIALMKGAFGGGFALIGVPILSLYVPPLQAATIVAVLVSLMDLFALAAYPPRTWDKRQLRILVPGALCGMALGSFILGKAPEALIGLAIGVISVVFACQWLGKRAGWFGTGGEAAKVPGARAGVFWSGVSGFTSLLAHAGGPPLSVYLLPQRLSKTVLAGTQTVFFSLGNTVKLVPYLLLGHVDRETLVAIALIAPSVPLGVFLGRILHGRLRQDMIYIACYVLVLIAGLNMLVRFAISTIL